MSNLEKLASIDTPLTDKILELGSNLLIVFRIIVDNLNLIAIIEEKAPQLFTALGPELLTLIVTVFVGMIVIYSVFLILINICKFTLNFMIFFKWAGIIILAIGAVYNFIG